MKTHFSILAWRILCTEEPAGYIQSILLQRVGSDSQYLSISQSKIQGVSQPGLLFGDLQEASPSKLFMLQYAASCIYRTKLLFPC